MIQTGLTGGWEGNVAFTRTLPSHGISLMDAPVPCGANEVRQQFGIRGGTDQDVATFYNSHFLLNGRGSGTHVSLPWPSQDRVPEVALVDDLPT